ncbi:hypothetical protein CSKR_109276 [Clonorchis sinensis]|uniref:Uncharacterized protein n=1 Tax=Clonorchis sinensis TaxID=79923 RepID=A0A3R7GKD2_CLOSI|nr:hypothetical protein CSKR_109276 [Clonorchis sinensis]
MKCHGQSNKSTHCQMPASEIMYLLSLIYASALINPHVCFTCPPNFRKADGGVCFVVERDTFKFCDAAAYCASYGEGKKQLVYLIGRNILRLPRLVGDVHGVHTGLNFLLEPPNMGTLVWRDLDPNSPEYTATEEAICYENRSMETSSRDFPMWIPKERLICSVPSYGSRYMPQTICEYGGNLPDDHRQVRFLSSFPKPLSALVHSDARLSGCDHMVTARTKLDCARSCALKLTCRSIYHDSGTNSCVHMMHADSLLSLSTGSRGSGWVRFAKTSLVININGEM